MLFRKKPDIPPRPNLPTIEQIVDDILNSPPTDVAFKMDCAERNTVNDSKSDLDTPEDAYLKVKNFMEIITKLKQDLNKLQDQSEALKISDLELKAMADDIRKQALEALQ